MSSPGGGEDRTDESDDQSLTATGLPDAPDRASLVGQFYRGEVDRMVGWRTRLDQTTNWAVVLMAAILTFSFSSRQNPHYVLLVGALAVLAFLLIESQRYQEYDAWRYRVRLLQKHFLAPLLDSGDPAEDDSNTGGPGKSGGAEGGWQRELAENLRHPVVLLSRPRAVGHRLRRVYIFLLTVLVAAWLLRISVFEPNESWSQAAAIASFSGDVVVATVLTLYLGLWVIAVWSFFADRSRAFRDEPT